MSRLEAWNKGTQPQGKGRRVGPVGLVRLCALLVACQVMPVIAPVHAQQAPPLSDLNFGLSGSWYDPVTSGQGFLIEVIPESQLLFVTWFTFQESSEPSPAAGLVADEQRWFIAQGAYEGNVAEIPLFATTGGRFNDGDPVSLEQVGTLRVQFANCAEAALSITFDGSQTTRDVAIRRLTPDAFCFQLIQSAR